MTLSAAQQRPARPPEHRRTAPQATQQAPPTSVDTEFERLDHRGAVDSVQRDRLQSGGRRPSAGERGVRRARHERP
eukprot:11161431-Alexandrium_andersonii.AAC.1